MEARSTEASPDACVFTNAKGVIQEANQQAAEMLGLPPTAMRGKLLIAFVARGDTTAFREQFGQVDDFVRNGRPIRVRLRARGGSPFQADLRVQGGSEPASYCWTIRAAADRTAENGRLHEVLGALARLVRRGPRETDEANVRIGDCVARAIESVHAVAEERGVRFVIEGGDPPVVIRAVGPTLEQSIAAALRAALAAAPRGAELRLRLTRNGDETALEVQVDGVEAPSVGSPISVVLLAARLAADGGRLELADGEAPSPLMRVNWPAES